MDVDTEEISLQSFELAKSVVVALPRAPTNQDDDEGDGDEEPGFEYVTHMDRSCSDGQLAAALTTREIKLYARDTMLLRGQLAGHTAALTQLAYAPSDANALFSASEDGTVRGWDTRSAASTFKFGQSGEEIWSMALGYDGHLCAAGKGCTVEFFDLRKSGKALGTYAECHTDDVTQLRFHPNKHSFLLTGSEDGLMCYFDTRVSLEEDALDSVMNAECAVRTVGFFGPEGESVYCCSNTETLSLWHASGAQRIVDFGDVRALARGEKFEAEAEAGAGAGDGDSDSKTSEGEPGGKEWGVAVDSIVGCRYDSEADRLWLVAGGFEGGACLATVSPDGITPEAVLSGGHSEQVRTFDWMGQTIATGGEDAKVCLWRVPGSGSAVGGGEEDDGAMGDPSGDGAGRGGGVAQTASGARRAENRAARTFRPYDADGRGR